MLLNMNCRAICNLTKADDFNGLRREIALPVIERLRRTYEHVDDIDLFSGESLSIKQLISILILTLTRWLGRNTFAWWSGRSNLCLHHRHTV